MRKFISLVSFVILLVAFVPASANAAFRPLVYLTFDDGPGPYTYTVLNILKQYNAKATFFVEGRRIVEYPDQYAAIVRHGHVVANHTDTHRDLTTLSKTLVQRELTVTQRKMGTSAGTCFRPPFLATNDRVVQWAKDVGLKQNMPHLSGGKALETDPQRIVNRIVPYAFDGAIVLMHAEETRTEASVRALRRIVPQLIDKGYDLRALPNC